eukprot:816318_1
MKRNSSNPNQTHPIPPAQPYNPNNNNNNPTHAVRNSSNQIPPAKPNEYSFKPKDIVMFGAHEAEVMRVLSDNQFEITFPVSQRVLQRSKARVHASQLEKKHVKFNIVPKKKKVLPPKPPPSSSSSVEKEFAPFVSHMSAEDAAQLSVHEKIDHRDQVGRFVFATVSEKQGSKLKIHYDGWSRKWDTWSDFGVELHRFAVSGSISLRPSHRDEFCSLKKGDYVDINPSQRHFGWKVGEIRRLDAKSGQVQVVYEYLDKNYLYWAHLDNAAEIASFASESGKKEEAVQPQQVQAKEAEVDEMEAWNRIRSKRFPRYANEEISNQYGIGEWLEVQDTQTLQWITATVIDKENNWICVHFDGWPSKYDQKIHVMKHARRLRALGADLGETQEERDIRQEMESFLVEVEQLNWKLQTVDADGNCLYRCFAINIYADTDKHMLVRRDCCQYMRQNKSFFVNFIPDFEERLREKEAENEWGDHVDIAALSELYNVRVRVFEYDCASAKLYMSFESGEHAESVNLPLILLARHRKKHYRYNIICDPQAVHSRPLGLPSQREEHVSLREIRLNEDAKEEHKEGANDDKEAEDDIKYHINEQEFIRILEEYNIEPPLHTLSLSTVFEPLTTAVHRKLQLHCKQNHLLDERILNRFWETQNHSRSLKEWMNELQQKIPNGQYPINAAITSFNQVIVNSISDNFQAVIGQSRKRQSTIENQKHKMKNTVKTGKRKLKDIQNDDNDLNEPQHKKSKLNSENKPKMSVKEVAKWMGSLGSAYKQYIKPCIENGIDGSLMDELNEDSLSDMVANKIHRKKIMLEWYKL